MYHIYQLIEEYIALGYARELSMVEAKGNREITNYIPHHGVLNINKPGKVRIRAVFCKVSQYVA